MRVLFLGSAAAYSQIVFRRLLRAGATVCGVITTEPPSSTRRSQAIPVALEHPLAALAREHGYAVEVAAYTQEAAALERVRAWAPELMLTACFGHILPPAWLALPRVAGLNLHPSLLPAYRGPVPLFWQLRNGETVYGVSLHHVISQIDAGRVVGRWSTSVAPGETEESLTRLLAAAGAELALDAVARLRAGEPLAGEPQDASDASYYPVPAEQDFRLDTSWPVARAYRFVTGTRAWGRRYALEIDGVEILVVRALGFVEEERLASAFERDDGRLRVGFATGVLDVVGEILEG